MKSLMAPNIPLAIVFLVAVAAVALRAVARRPEAPATGPAPVTVITGQGQSQPQAALTARRHDGPRGEMARPPAPPGRPASAVDQAQHIFHELHADGRNTLCAVCDVQYGAALRQLLTEPVAGGRVRWGALSPQIAAKGSVVFDVPGSGGRIGQTR